MKGFSLLELLIVLFLISLTFAFGLPLTSYWYQNQVAELMQKDIEQAIEQGIQESIILGEPLRLIPLKDQVWTSGLQLIKEEGVPNKPTLIHVWQWPSTPYHIAWHGFLGNTFLRFVPDISQSAMNGYFLIENQNHQEIKIIVNRIGRIRKIYRF